MPMIARLFAFVSLIGLLCLSAGRAGALDLVNVALAPLPPFVIEGAASGDLPGIVTEILNETFRRDGKLAKYGDAILSALGCRHAGSLEHCS